MKFELTKDELKLAEEWVESKPEKAEGAIGGRYSFMFTPTGLGTIAKIVDNAPDTPDERELVLTDFSKW